jgi:hypothetical protein
MAGKSKTDAERAWMKARCEQIARKYRLSDEGTPSGLEGGVPDYSGKLPPDMRLAAARAVQSAADADGGK